MDTNLEKLALELAIELPNLDFDAERLGPWFDGRGRQPRRRQ